VGAGPAAPRLASGAVVPRVGVQLLPPTIGRYLIERLLGSGGMGVVYIATDPALGRRGAVKRLRGCDAFDAERIQHEARSAAAVVHPNVVTIYDVGTDAGSVFVA